MSAAQKPHITHFITPTQHTCKQEWQTCVLTACVSAETLRLSDPGLCKTLHRPQLSAQTRQITLFKGATSQKEGTTVIKTQTSLSSVISYSSSCLSKLWCWSVSSCTTKRTIIIHFIFYYLTSEGALMVKRLFKDVSSAHQGCIYSKKCNKNCEILLQFKISVNIC